MSRGFFKKEFHGKGSKMLLKDKHKKTSGKRYKRGM